MWSVALLFILFINDLELVIRFLDGGIQIGEENLSILLFADDIALLYEADLQLMLDSLLGWCDVNCISVKLTVT